MAYAHRRVIEAPETMKAERKVTPPLQRRPPRDATEAVPPHLERFERHLEAARRIPKRDVRRFRGDRKLVIYNLARGLKAVLAHEARIRAELPAVDLDELRALRDIYDALRIAADEAQNRKNPRNELHPLLAEARKLRKAMLATAKSFVVLGIWPEGIVTNIRKGKGAFDTAMDCLALADYFEAHEKEILGKSPITRHVLDRAHTVGERLVKIIKPRHARPQKNEPWRAAAERRDRLWTLLYQRHETLWRVGAYLFGHEVTTHVPPLQTRRIKRKKPEASA